MPAKSDAVYSVTVIDISDEDRPPHYHTPAIFTKVEDAISVVRNNDWDISENGSNQYAVVEKTWLDQLYPQGEDRIWFEWNSVEEEYEQIEVPHQYAKVISFGIS